MNHFLTLRVKQTICLYTSSETFKIFHLILSMQVLHESSSTRHLDYLWQVMFERFVRTDIQLSEAFYYDESEKLQENVKSFCLEKYVEQGTE